ncbi:2-oxo-4-hydroxy-4-carboxy-5-ureidoimidazoline decarboxylase-like [Epargyreus clarus]|uniref:2-oxo-4-hydroxy-4-carboxy-5-ureidoimidazoline decarboxylase-like n=1 Tax=Epargyreus clarus TaxID=520877 RepID=UPI003C308315
MALLLTISEVNKLEDEQFERLFNNVIELWPDAAVQVKKSRPFADLADICNSFYRYMDNLSEGGKLGILKSHPDLAGKLAARGELTSESAAEQKSAGLNDLTDKHRNIIISNNERYKTKFGFPFIICARENKVQSIIEGLQKRYYNKREEEISVGINEVKKICRLRILDIVKDDANI